MNSLNGGFDLDSDILRLNVSGGYFEVIRFAHFFHKHEQLVSHEWTTYAWALNESRSKFCGKQYIQRNIVER